MTSAGGGSAALPERIRRYAYTASTLALHSDVRLAEVVAGATVLGSGIGGTTVTLDVDGVPVFVKRVPLTDLERRPENVASTANIFGVPAECQYGIAEIGGPGFGAWRELAAAIMTTNWVLAGRTEAFPLLYHWRVLPGSPHVFEEHADVERAVAYWGGAPGVRDRILALAGSSASLVLFFEYVPWELRHWLVARLDAGPDAIVAAFGMVERRLLEAVTFLGANGLAHFDLHFANLLTDGERVYVGDLGLATSPRFDLSAPDREFLARNRSHDLAYVLARLVNWLVAEVCGLTASPGHAAVERNDYIRRVADGTLTPEGIPAELAATIARYAPVAVVVNDFYWDFFGVSRSTPWPAAAVEAALARVGVQVPESWLSGR